MPRPRRWSDGIETRYTFTKMPRDRDYMSKPDFIAQVNMVTLI